MLSLIARWEEAVLGPRGPNLNDLRLLALGGGNSRQERLNEVLEWRYQRGMAVAKGMAGTAAGFFGSLVLSAFKAELHMPPVLFAGALAGAILIGLSGVYVFARARNMPSEYARLLLQLELMA